MSISATMLSLVSRMGADKILKGLADALEYQASIEKDRRKKDKLLYDANIIRRTASRL
jgi:hypothetical protein